MARRMKRCWMLTLIAVAMLYRSFCVQGLKAANVRIELLDTILFDECLHWLLEWSGPLGIVEWISIWHAQWSSVIFRKWTKSVVIRLR